jgi:hypothetical protein
MSTAGTMSTPEPGPVEHQAIVAYLGEIASHLPGNADAHRDILDELEHGLDETVRAHRRRGLGPAAAAQAAIAEFGPARLIATAHASEIRLRQVRRGGWATFGLLVLGSVVWQAYHHAVGDLSFAVPSTGWARQAFLALTVTMPVVPGIAQFAAVVLAITCINVAPAHERGQTIVRWLTLALAAAMGLMLANMVAMFALTPSTLPVLHRWLVPSTLVAIGASGFALSVLAAYRAWALSEAPR